MNTAFLDVAIGLILSYLLLSLICTAVQEYVAVKLGLRAGDLRAGLRSILVAPDQTSAAEHDERAPGTQKKDLATLFMEHPLFSGLSQARSKSIRHAILAPLDTALSALNFRTEGPSYIPSNAFSKALIDVLRQESGLAIQSYSDLRVAAEQLPDGPVRTRFLAVTENATANFDRAIGDIEDFFDATMDRVSGWYKRRSQFILFFIAFVLAVGFNVDSIQLATRLYEEPTLRQEMVAQAQKFVDAGRPDASVGGPVASAGDPDASAVNSDPSAGARDAPADARAAVNETNERNFSITVAQLKALPIGWQSIMTDSDDMGHAFLRLLGWLLTAMAASLGAPFWFDLLNSALRIRATGIQPKTAAERRVAGQSTTDSSALPTNSPASPTDAERYESPPIGPANTFERSALSADDIKDLQAALAMGDEQLSGTLDRLTRARIAEYQKRHGFDVTGLLSQTLAARLLES